MQQQLTGMVIKLVNILVMVQNLVLQQRLVIYKIIKVQTVFSFVMEHPADQGSILWHCTEGKDRCGLVTAMLLTALSVSREQIVEDYLITNEVNGPKAEAMYQKLLASGRGETVALSVREAYLAKREIGRASCRERVFADV